MSALPEILAHNAAFVAGKGYEEFLTSPLPNKRLVVITCMDTRLVELLPKAMGIRNGDVKMIKIAGAVVSHPFGSVMRSVLVAVYQLGAEEIAVVGHHGCGMTGLSPDEVLDKARRRGISAETLNTLDHAGVDLQQVAHRFRKPAGRRPRQRRPDPQPPAAPQGRRRPRPHHAPRYRPAGSADRRTGHGRRGEPRPGDIRSGVTPNRVGCNSCLWRGATPSPPYSGERAGVRGGPQKHLGKRTHLSARPLTLALSPAYREEGTGEGTGGIRHNLALHLIGRDAACRKLAGSRPARYITFMGTAAPPGGSDPPRVDPGPVYHYDAFISYRHVEPDRAWARWLHAALETYRIPRKLAPARIGRADGAGLPRRGGTAGLVEPEGRHRVRACTGRGS